MKRFTSTGANEITNLRTSNKFMVSFEVESLFTNIPLLESIELAVDYILSGNPNIKLSKDSLKELFLVATAQTHFLFKGKYYDQIDGVAMGSPLAPVLANLVMGHFSLSNTHCFLIIVFSITSHSRCYLISIHIFY